MNSRRHLTVVLVLAGGILLGSCSITPKNAPVATETEDAPTDLRPIAGLNWGDGSPVRGVYLDLGHPTQSTELSQLNKQYDTTEESAKGVTLIPFGVQPDGTLVGSQIPSTNMDAETFELTAGSQIGQYNAKGFAPFQNTDSLAGNDGYRQAYAGNLSDRYFVWAETESTNIFESSWRIFTYSFESQESALLSKAEDFSPTEQLPILSDDTKPIVKGDFVYWHTSFLADGSSNFKNGVYSMPANGSEEPNQLTVDAILPAALSEGIVVTNTSTAPVDDTPDDSEGTRPILTGVSIVSDSGAVEQLISVAPSAVNPEFAAPATGANNHIILSYDAQTLIVNVTNKEVIAFDEPVGSILTSVQQCGNVSTWAYLNRETGVTEGQYFYDNETGTLSQIQLNNLYGSTLCNGEWFATSTLEETDMFATWTVYNLHAK